MRFLIFVYGDKRCRRFPISKDKNNNCQILLPKEDFELEETIFLQLCNVSEEWYIRETAGYKLKKDQFFQLERQERDEIILYRLNTERKYSIVVQNTVIYIQLVYHKSDWNIFQKFELKECEITKGKNNIVIKQINIKNKNNIEMLYKQDSWIINNNGNVKAYINERLLERSRKLVYGDIIYIFDVMFVFLGEYLAIEETEEKSMDYRKENFLNEVILVGKSKEKKNILTVQKEKFHRAPRIMEELKSTTIHIEPPPVLNIQKNRSVFMDIGAVINMMIPMLGMNLFLIYGIREEQNQTGIYVYSGLFMAVISAVCSILWIIIARQYEQKEQEKKINKKKNDYKKYLKKKDAFIKKQYEITRKVMQSRYLRADSYADNPLLQMYLWNRNPYHKDFLMHRVGVGEIEFPVKIILPQEEVSGEENLLWREAEEMKKYYAFLHQMPMLLDMEKYNQIGIIGEAEKERMGLLRSIISQVAVSNCYTEVKIACIYDKDKIGQLGQWDFCRWLPHIWNNDRQRRYIATSRTEARQLFYELFQIFKEREAEEGLHKSRKRLPHYILIITEYRFLEGEMFSKYISDQNGNYGLTVIWITDRRDSLPNTCRLVLEVNDEFSGQYEIERHSQKREKIVFDYTEKEVTDKLIRSISGVRVAEIEEKAEIPESIDFLEMYGVKKIEDLEIEKRWERNKIFESASVLIGKKEGGESCYLDIHERYHGPHGLVAGTTGSGKSEVLQTFILSMAVNFSPEAVNFLLIDYKGEGMSGLFSKLPHITGKISNLSDGQAYRAMISIKSENRRRQTIFKEAKVNNINDYTKLYVLGHVTEPIPHLLIIIDEFAELKKAEPEFMQELISVAQVGRSLGIHLILATQKPGGVVDDKIWSNSKFRICLKVQEREDSMDMLHNTDACEITQTGRGYLQVGNNEMYELFQAGWSGAPFQKIERKSVAQIVNIDGETYYVDDIDDTKKTESNSCELQNERFEEMKITQLQAVNTYIASLANRKNLESGRKLWMEPLPQYLYLEYVLEQNKRKGMEKKHNSMKNSQNSFEDKLEVCVGIFDNPESQEQPVFSLKLLESGHIGICGRSVSGKSTFLQTFIYSMFENKLNKEVSLYLLDFNGGGMNIYSSVSQVKLVIQEDKEELEKMFKSVTDELKRRKKSFSGGNFRQYQNKKSTGEQKEDEFPLILIVLDGFTEFCEETYHRYEEELYFILREGEKLGVLVIVTVESFSSMHMSMRLSEFFKTRICFYMKDTYAYIEAFDVIKVPVTPKKGVSGRGIAYYGDNILEFQTALVTESRNDYERQEKIMELLYKRNGDVC